MKNQFDLKPKGLTFSYKCPYPEWYDLVALHWPRQYKHDRTYHSVSYTIRRSVSWGCHRVRFFSLSLSGSAFTWFSSLLVNSITNWADLEKKFHTYFYTGTGENKITDLTTIRQRTNESGIKFLQRFRETRNLCFSLNLTDDHLAALAVQRMLPT